MDGNGCRRDNVIVERFWKSIKDEKVCLHARESVSTAKAGIARYVSLNRAAPLFPAAKTVEKSGTASLALQGTLFHTGLHGDGEYGVGNSGIEEIDILVESSSVSLDSWTKEEFVAKGPKNVYSSQRGVHDDPQVGNDSPRHRSVGLDLHIGPGRLDQKMPLQSVNARRWVIAVAPERPLCVRAGHSQAGTIAENLKGRLGFCARDISNCLRHEQALAIGCERADPEIR